MNKPLFAVAFVFLASAFSVPALADSFTGVCTLSGTATLDPPIGLIPNPTATYSFDTDGTVINQCSGVLNGVQVVNATASAHAEGSGILQGLGCGVSTGSGPGTLTIAGTPIGFSMTIVGTGPQVTLVIQGNVGGAATGQASFATDTNATSKCASPSGASSLIFVVAATAANLSD